MLGTIKLYNKERRRDESFLGVSEKMERNSFYVLIIYGSKQIKLNVDVMFVLLPFNGVYNKMTEKLKGSADQRKSDEQTCK